MSAYDLEPWPFDKQLSELFHGLVFHQVPVKERQEGFVALIQKPWRHELHCHLAFPLRNLCYKDRLQPKFFAESCSEA
jgi:hypothetical protein